MKAYRAFFRPDGHPPTMVKSALSKRVLVFSWFGLLLHGAWISALLAGSVSLVASACLPGSIALALHLAMHLGLAAFTSEIRGWELRLAGAIAGPIVMGYDKASALLRLIDKNPSILSSRQPGLSA